MDNVKKSVQSMLEQRKSEIINSDIIVSESFGDYALSEDAVNIRSKVNKIQESGNCSLDDMNEVITMVRESNLSIAAQKNIVSKVFEMWNASETEVVEEGIFNLGNSANRFDGDPAKNAEYIALLNEMDAFITYMVDVMEGDFAVADDILKLFEDAAKKAKKKEDLDKLLSSCLNRMDKGNTTYNSATYKKYYDLYVKFNRLSKSFNNRYSKITMTEKKVVDAKFDQILEKLSTGMVRDWFVFQEIGNETPKTDRLNEAYLKLKEVDRDTAVNIANRIINTMYKVISSSWSQTVGNVRYMRKILGIELEGTAKWKIVHKIFK